jgi:hypothetical protein
LFFLIELVGAFVGFSNAVKEEVEVVVAAEVNLWQPVDFFPWPLRDDRKLYSISECSSSSNVVV